MTRLKIWLTLLSAILLLPTGAWAQEVWQATGFEDSPTNGDQVSAGAGKLRDTRLEVRSRGEVEHFWGDGEDDTDDDNGLHRLGSARCFIQAAAPTVLNDAAAEHVNTGAAAETDLDNAAFNSAAGTDDDLGTGRCWIDDDGADNTTNDECTDAAAPNACCTAADTGTCDADDNKLYIYVGVAGDAGSPPTGYVAGWQEVIAQHDTIADFVEPTDAGARVKAGSTDRNILFNGDFDYEGCTGTTRPSGWSETGSPTFTYATGDTTQGVGCNVLITDVGGGDDIRQELANLKGSTTYRVTAQVRETAADDVCTLSTSGADTELAGTVASSGTSWAQLDATFITAAALDTVTLILTNTAAGDICHWDHIAVYRQEATEVPEAGIVAVFDTYTTSDGAAVSPEGTGFADVPELSITFVPPTEGWIIQVGSTVSVGCSTGCSMSDSEGFACRLEKGGSLIAGTQNLHTVRDFGVSATLATSTTMGTVDINPAAGTSITYTVACSEDGVSGLLYNFQSDDATNNFDSQSNLWMIAHPPR